MLKKLFSRKVSAEPQKVVESSLPADSVRSIDRDRLRLCHEDDPRKYAGVIRLELMVSPEAQGSSELSAELTHQPGSRVEFGKVEAGTNIFLGVNFAMLPNGEYELLIRLQEPDGGISVVLHAIEVKHTGALASQTCEALKEGGVPLFFLGACDAGMYPYERHQAWFDRPDAFLHIESLVSNGQVTPGEAKRLQQFVTDGFMVIEDLIDEDLVDAVNQEIDQAIAAKYQGYQFGSSQRIEHLHEHYDNVRRLWLDQRHRRYANLIFGANARPCQTLTYVFGSQQDAHQDTIHLTPFPAGYMCGTWIALQDVVPDSGELIVYPGSHRERRVYLKETGCEKVGKDWSEFGSKVNVIWQEMLSRYHPFVYRPKKGTVLIWHENLLHAGSVRMDKTLERRSIVIHSFADGALAYYDSIGLAGSAVRMEVLSQEPEVA